LGAIRDFSFLRFESRKQITNVKVATALDIQRLDSSAIVNYGISESILMENAAIAARGVIARRWGVPGRRVLVACGPGNNGGDGFALARLLYSQGATVTVLVAGRSDINSRGGATVGAATNRGFDNSSRLQDSEGAAGDNLRIAQRLPLKFLQLYSLTSLLAKTDFDSFDVIVDALLGVGLSRNLEGPMAALVERINASDTPILSLDIPSGVNADTGEVLGVAVRAEVTVVFGLLKRGNLLYPGFDLGGDLYCSEISYPPELCNDDSIALSVNVPPVLSAREPAGHKGTFGKILIVGGSPGYCGAVALAGGAALRSGVGYVYLAIPSAMVSQAFPLVPEAVFLPQGESSYLGSEHLPKLLEASSRADAVVLGSGLSTQPESIRLALELIALIEAPLIIDGDGLTALAGRDELSRSRTYPTFLTPHSKEMARLLGSSPSEVSTRRIDTALEAADRYGAMIVLKGAHSIIANPNGKVWINLTGNAGMGTAGSGDVLAGLLGALAASHPNLDSADLLRLAVYLHGLAGDLASLNLGQISLNARDIVTFLPQAFMEHKKKLTFNPFSGKIMQI